MYALVFDIGRTPGYLLCIMSQRQSEKRWRAYLRGEATVRVTEGRIVRLFEDGRDDEPYFEVAGDGYSHTRSFFCHGDISHYAVGYYAKVEQTLIYEKNNNGNLTVVRIWIDKSAS